jgi:hypothetical protein
VRVGEIPQHRPRDVDDAQGMGRQGDVSLETETRTPANDYDQLRTLPLRPSHNHATRVLLMIASDWFSLLYFWIHRGLPLLVILLMPRIGAWEEIIKMVLGGQYFALHPNDVGSETMQSMELHWGVSIEVYSDFKPSF